MKRIGFIIILSLSLFMIFGFSYSSHEINSGEEINTITLPRPEQNFSTNDNDDVNLSYEERYNFAYDFLKNNGFEHTDERINASLNDKLEDDIEKVLGFSLTDSEKSILIKRDNLIDNIPKIEMDFISLVGNDYAGKYYDPEKGKLYLASTRDDDKLNYDFSKKHDGVTVVKAKFSLKELENKLTKLKESVDYSESDNVITSIDHRKNLIIVNTNNLNKIKENILDLGDEYFEVNNIPSDTLIKPYLDLFLGVRIHERLSSNACSNGFYAVDNNSKKVSVTAGHCSPYNHGNNWVAKGPTL